jgi:hypothetical protein
MKQMSLHYIEALPPKDLGKREDLRRQCKQITSAKKIEIGDKHPYACAFEAVDKFAGSVIENNRDLISKSVSQFSQLLEEPRSPLSGGSNVANAHTPRNAGIIRAQAAGIPLPC